MPSLIRILAASLAFASLSLASPAVKFDRRSSEVDNGVNYTVFEHAATGGKLKFVTNSGICETTKGVNQYSGYFSVGNNMNMWFWFFESRNNPKTAPLATWFNGGPGCSSMIGLFQENGPCHFVGGSSSPSLNPYSWNTFANMLYIDQPIGTGFSYGNDPVTGTVSAAPYVWQLLQAFFTQFPQYQSRDFGLFTESYGGHYGPEFADYFEQQNAANKGQKINLVALGINNGWFDASLQEKAYVDFSYSNTYKPMISSAQHSQLLDTYNSQCAPALARCKSSGSDTDCSNAVNTCYNGIEGPLSQSTSNGGVASYDFDVYDIRAPSNDPNPPETYATYLKNPSVTKAIGAKSAYQECADQPYNAFSATGDNARGFISQLSDVVKSGVQTVVWAGDADWICNWFGGQAAAEAVSFSGQSSFKAKNLTSYTVSGQKAGTFKTQDNFSFLRVFGAGHEVPFYQPQAALQVFKQIMSKTPLSST